MTIDKAKLDSLLHETYTWFTAFDEIRMRQSIRLLIQQMQNAIDRKDYREAWFFVDQLNDLTDKSRDSLFTEPREQSLIRVECALAVYRMGNLPEALKILRTTLEMYDREYGRHYEATVIWILGCIQWQTPDQRNHAIVSWENSIEIFQDLVNRSLDILNVTRSTWYSGRIAEMNATLELALQPPRLSTSDSEESPNPNLQADTPAMSPTSISSGDFLR
jgi:hypothetical protein